MKRAIAWALAAACASGCQNASQPSDPFLNPARVPPPTTGQITPLQPGLTGPPAAGTIAAPPPPTMNAPAVSMPQNQATVPNQYMPPGGYHYNRSAVPTPSPPASTVPPPGTMYPGSPGATGSGSSIYQQPRSSWNRRGESNRQSAAGSDRVAAEQPSSNTSSGQVLRTNFEEPTDGADGRSSQVAPMIAGPTDRGETFGYDAQYRWLHGRLEYLESRRQWKLRYIALDGTTDQYGGSVVLTDNGQLAGYRSGDFVSVRGQVESTSGQPQRGYAPTYRLTAIERLSEAAP